MNLTTGMRGKVPENDPSEFRGKRFTLMCIDHFLSQAHNVQIWNCRLETGAEVRCVITPERFESVFMEQNNGAK